MVKWKKYSKNVSSTPDLNKFILMSIWYLHIKQTEQNI